MGRVHGDAQLFCTQALLGAMIALRLTLLATAAFAAPAAEADADPQFLLGHGLAYAAPLVHHVPLCKIVPKTVVVGQRCHAEPDCTTETVVVGRHVTGVEEPTCTDVEHVVPAVVPHVYGKREAEADPQLLVAAPYVAHATTKVTTKHCAPGAPILEDVTTDVTKCVPKQVCEDVTAEVLKTVCGEPEAEAEVEEA